VANFPSSQDRTKEVLNQKRKSQDGHQTNVTLLLSMIGMNNEKQPMCLQKAENHNIWCAASIALVF